MKRVLLAAAAVLGYARFARPWHLRWGATDPEVAEALPGDDLVASPKISSTRAVTIDAPMEAVWPWLAQIGQGRGGFYSYTWFENLFLSHMKNADRIHEEWQRIEPGDHIRTHPLVPLEVAKVEPGRYIVLRESWTFLLKPLPGGRTRLIVRGLGGYRAPNLVMPPLNFLYWRGVYEPLHFVMERGMMLGLKERAERAWRERPARAGRVGGAEG